MLQWLGPFLWLEGKGVVGYYSTFKNEQEYYDPTKFAGCGWRIMVKLGRDGSAYGYMGDDLEVGKSWIIKTVKEQYGLTSESESVTQ